MYISGKGESKASRPLQHGSREDKDSQLETKFQDQQEQIWVQNSELI